MRNVFAIGDSHSIFYYDSINVNHHWLGWAGMPVTMYQFNLHNLPLYNIVERLSPGDICTLNIKENDIVLFIFGWNDIQKNIHTYGNNNYKEIINDMTKNYINKILQYSNGVLCKIKPIVNCVYPIPQNINDTIKGSTEERINYTLYMNEQLKILCSHHNIPFFEIYDLIQENNVISSKVIDNDKHHLDRKNNELRKIIESRLFDLIKLHYE